MALGEIATLFRATTTSRPGAPVITPGSIDPLTGRLTRTRQSRGGRSFRLGRDGLRLGDVLIPPAASLPCVLVSAANAKLQFSSWFVAARVEQGDPAAVWALLSCTSGMRARQAIATGSVRPHVEISALGALRLPVLAAADDRVGRVRELADEVAQTELDETGTAPNDRWDLAVAVRDPDILQDGAPLDSLASVHLGRADPREAIGEATAGYVRALFTRDVRDAGRSASYVRSVSNEVIIDPGDVLLTTDGSFAGAVARERAVAGRGVAVIRLREPHRADRVVEWLNVGGQGIVRALARGATIKHLAVADIRRIPVPSQALSEQMSGLARSNLAEELEWILWRQ